MKLAEDLGLPVETINQASLYFLEKIPNYIKELVILHKGKSATIYRPNVNLFIQLKVGRLSESDLADCLEFLKYARKTKEPVNRPKLQAVLNQEIHECADHESRLARLKQLRKAIS